MIALDEQVVEQVNALGTTKWSGMTWRYATQSRDPLSGEGARRFGGRWNPRGSFPVTYLSTALPTAMHELERLADAAGMTPFTLIDRGYSLYSIEAYDIAVLDLRDTTALESLGLRRSDIADPDWTACQSVGHAAWFLEMQGVLAPSASGVGEILAVFEGRVRLDQLAVLEVTELTAEIFRAGVGCAPDA